MSAIEEKRGFPRIAIRIQDLLFVLACFFFLFFRLHPVLFLESENPVFLNTGAFLMNALTTPGGGADWLTSLFMQLWVSDLAASMLLTVCMWLVVFLTRKLMQRMSDAHPFHTVHLIPACLLLPAYLQYDFRLNYTIVLIINLLAVIVFLRWAPARQAYRIVAAVLISAFLYWITGGAFVLFGGLIGLNDIILARRFVSGSTVIVLAAAIPFAAVNTVFLVPVRYGYTHNLIMAPALSAIGLPVFYVASVILVFLLRLVMVRKFLQKGKPAWILSRIGAELKVAAGAIIVLGGAFIVANRYENTMLKHVLQLNQAVREERWNDVLEISRSDTHNNPLTSCQTNLALYETGDLLEKMFAYPQNEGTAGLVMDVEWCSAWPEETSTIYWKLGFVSEAQHWCHEALEQKGYTASILQRLGTIYMVKGDSGAAARYFRNLENVPFHASTAEALERLNAHPSALTGDTVLGRIQSMMPKVDYISLGHPSSYQLELLLTQNRSNRMALEYLAAYHLLGGNLRIIVSMIPEFESLNYARLPRSLQEALIFNAAVTPDANPELLIKWVHPLVRQRFGEFRNAYAAYHGDKYSARKGLQAQYGDTYWYYLMFVRPASKKSGS